MDIPSVEKLLDEFVSEMFSQWKTFNGGSASEGMKRLVSKEINEVSAKAVRARGSKNEQHGVGRDSGSADVNISKSNIRMDD